MVDRYSCLNHKQRKNSQLTLNFPYVVILLFCTAFYVCALLFSYLTSTMHCSESPCARFICFGFPGRGSLQQCLWLTLLLHGLCALFLHGSEIHGPSGRESGTMLGCQRHSYSTIYKISIFYILQNQKYVNLDKAIESICRLCFSVGGNPYMAAHKPQNKVL